MVLSTIKDYKMKTESIYLYVLCLRMVSIYLIATMFAPFQKSIGISLDKMAILEAFFWLIMFGMEVPTGIIADKKGRAWAIKVGSALFALGIFSYSLAFNFWSALIAETFVATGMAFNSGADDAWITDALAREGKDTLKEVQANKSKWIAIVAIVCGTLGAYIAEHMGYRIVWFIGGISVTISLVVAMWQINGQGEVIANKDDKGSEKTTSVWDTINDSIHIWRTSWPLKWASLAFALFYLGFTFNHYWPIYFSGDLGMKEHLGVVWVVIFPPIMIGPWILKSYYKKQAQKKKQDNKYQPKSIEVLLILLALFFTGFGLSAAGLSDNIGFAFLFCMVHEIGRGLLNPVIKPYIHERIQSKYRATYDSLQNMINSGSTFTIYMVIATILHDKPPTADSISSLWITMGTALVGLTFILFLIRPRLG